VMTNPNPELITDEMWQLWLGAEAVIPGVRLSGIYADKKGYHNTVKANQKKWPGTYSIELDLDLKHGNLDKARAIDLTMSDSEMVKWTQRVKKSALDPHDNRLQAVREFYGTLDNKTVYGLIKDSETGDWRPSSADSTHLWHGHTSIFTAFVNNWPMLSPVVSVWQGQTLEEWVNPMSMFPTAKQGDTSEDVRYWQLKYSDIRRDSLPTLPPITVDGVYGDATVACFTAFALKVGAAADYKSTRISAWLAQAFDKALIRSTVPHVSPSPPVIIDPAVLTAEVNKWLEQNVTSQKFKFTGEVTGEIDL
jgi:hypothetical protein